MDFTHLILLIGTNPLPNYVVARYFLAKNPQLKKLTAIHTKDTFEIARRLESVLKKRYPNLQYRFLGLAAPGNAAQIHEDIGRALHFQPEETAHLNYTGGTKNMSVHAYQTLLAQLQQNKLRSLTFSYLDAHDFKLKFDHDRPDTDNLREEVKITMGDLLTLHGCKPKEESEKSEAPPDWSAANAVIQKFIKHGQLRDFVKWKNHKIRGLFYDDEDKPRKPSYVSLAELQEDRRGDIRSTADAEHPFHRQAMQLLQAFPKAQAWVFDDHGQLLIPDAAKDFKNKKGNFVKGILYLDGLWLEDYVAEILREKIDAEELPFLLYPNWRVIKGEAQKEFEIDVMILNGYQLCGISMTTATKESLCKSKAFEIMHRAQQMGGEEARAILVTTLDEATALKIAEDLKTDTGGQQQLLILGADKLPAEKLWPAVKKHILGKPQ